MLDVLMPVRSEEIGQALTVFEQGDDEVFVGSIMRVGKHTDVPFRLLICIDGGTAADARTLRRFLPGVSHEWLLLANEGVRGYSFTLRELCSRVRSEFVAVLPGNIWLDDPKWFGKMQVVFTKDPHCYMVAADVPQTVSASMPPQKLTHRDHPNSEFFLTRRAALLNVGEFDDAEHFSRRSMQLGGSRWIASGVRYHAASSVAGTVGSATDSDS